MPIDNERFVALDIDALQQQSTGITNWIWQDYIACRSITLLTSSWKSGKTTLLSILLAKLNHGGLLAGNAVTPAPAIIVSEESHDLWVARHHQLQFGANVRWICQPFLRSPSRIDWEQLVANLVELNADRPGLVVIDPLACALPGNDENNATAVLNALSPLRQLTAAGAAVLLLHHPRKGKTLEPRGSGAISGFADILMYLHMPASAPTDYRRRRLSVKGRHAEIASERVIEWTADGLDYIVCDAVAEAYADGWSMVRWVLADARQKMTRDQILEYWPEAREKPPRSTLWDWLETAEDRGLICREGQGRKHRPFRYWLPEREKFFFPELPRLEPPGAEASLGEDLEFAKKVVERQT